MRRVQILDCTLRDGGYCNEWKFGNRNAKKILKGLSEADIDIIECGFLTNRVVYQENVTKFNTIMQIEELLPEKSDVRMHVVMINYGEYNLEQLPLFENGAPIGIRVAFHKQEREAALLFCEQIVAKGYPVFIQPMVSLNYSDQEFLEMIHRVNEICPYAFYIVDSFGMMKQKDLIRLFYMVEHNLKENICIGYHSHNNMQLAYSNAQALVGIQTKRNIIIDSSVFGMGRGAGNLNTELFVEYLNDSIDATYRLNPLLQIMDEVISEFYVEKPWGYSLPNYLSAAHNCHPNYAIYLNDKHTLTVESINAIFSMMDEKKKSDYDKKYIEDLYLHYMEHENITDGKLAEYKSVFYGKDVLLIASGKSVEDEKDKIVEFVRENQVISIGVNFDYHYLDTDYIFISNLRRYRELEGIKKNKTMITSNIMEGTGCLKARYEELLNDEEGVRDNASLMLIKLLIDLGVNKIYIAGIDGYSTHVRQNYLKADMEFELTDEQCTLKNHGMSKVLKDYSAKVDISFVTKEKYVTIS